MIIVIASFRVKPGERAKIAEIAKPCIEATRKEPGCLMYELHASVEDDQALVFIEKWKDKDALRAHSVSPHLKKFGEERAPYIDGKGEISLFEASPASF